jgi:hypothetical protein
MLAIIPERNLPRNPPAIVADIYVAIARDTSPFLAVVETKVIRAVSSAGIRSP